MREDAARAEAAAAQQVKRMRSEVRVNVNVIVAMLTSHSSRGVLSMIFT